jgi:hypothetical protein
MTRLTPGANACDQDVDETFGGSLTGAIARAA